MVARLGQQRELVTNALSKVVPLSMSSDLRLGMCRSARGFKSFTVRSSVRMRITLGRFGSCFWFSACFPSAEGKQAERAQAKATPGRVFASFFESLDLPGLCLLQVKCYTFPRWASPIPEDRRSVRSRRQEQVRSSRPVGPTLHPDGAQQTGSRGAAFDL